MAVNVLNVALRIVIGSNIRGDEMENKLTLNTLPYHYKDMVNLEYDFTHENQFGRYYESKINVLLLFKSDDDVVISSIGHFTKTIVDNKYVVYAFESNILGDLATEEYFTEDLEFSFIEIEGKMLPPVLPHVEN